MIPAFQSGVLRLRALIRVQTALQTANNPTNLFQTPRGPHVGCGCGIIGCGIGYGSVCFGTCFSARGRRRARRRSGGPQCSRLSRKTRAREGARGRAPRCASGPASARRARACRRVAPSVKPEACTSGTNARQAHCAPPPPVHRHVSETPHHDGHLYHCGFVGVSVTNLTLIANRHTHRRCGQHGLPIASKRTHRQKSTLEHTRMMVKTMAKAPAVPPLGQGIVRRRKSRGSHRMRLSAGPRCGCSYL